MSKTLFNLVGQKYHRLTVISKAESDKYNGTRWHCLCNCGNKNIVPTSKLRKGHTKSCGCLGKTFHIKHGLYKSLEYKTWCNMLSRCKNPNATGYKNYGGRGINVCERWLKFENFIEDMGFRPTPVHTIERINNNGNYTPENCRWSTRFQQVHNKRNKTSITFNGKALCQTEWSRLLFGNDDLVYARLKLGWSISKTLSTPTRKLVKK